MDYILKFSKNYIYLLRDKKTILKCKSSGFLFHFDFLIENNKNETILKYKYYTFFCYEKVKIIEQKTEDVISLIKDHKKFYTMKINNKKYRVEDTRGILKSNIAKIFLDNNEIGKINYGYLKSPWEMKITFNSNFTPDIYVFLLLIIKYSHFNSEA